MGKGMFALPFFNVVTHWDKLQASCHIQSTICNLQLSINLKEQANTKVDGGELKEGKVMMCSKGFKSHSASESSSDSWFKI